MGEDRQHPPVVVVGRLEAELDDDPLPPRRVGGLSPAEAGVAIRRTVPAMAAALTAWTVLQVTVVDALRQHYAAPLATAGTASAGSWLLGQRLLGPGGTPVTGPLTRLLPASVRDSRSPRVARRAV